MPREREHLLDQLGRAVDAGGEAPRGELACRVVGRPLQRLHLQLERGERRTQLVRGIGDEVFLRLEGMTYPVEQQVELLHQRAHLVGQPFLAHRRELVGLARRHLLAHAGHGRE